MNNITPGTLVTCDHTQSSMDSWVHVTSQNKFYNWTGHWVGDNPWGTPGIIISVIRSYHTGSHDIVYVLTPKLVGWDAVNNYVTEIVVE